MGFKGWKGGGKAGVLVYGFCVQGGHVVRKTSIQQGRRFSIVLEDAFCVQAGHVAYKLVMLHEKHRYTS